MLKALKNFLVICSIVLLSTSAYSMTRQEFIDKHEAAIIEKCEDARPDMDSDYNDMLRRFFRVPGRFECPLTNLYAMHKVMELMETLDRRSEGWPIFVELMETSVIKEYDTFDFIAIHQGYEAYLEGKTSE